MNLEELKQKVQEAGIVGAGGAGFPTQMKLNDAADTIIINGAECEPLLRVDRQLLTKYVKEILFTLNTLCTTMGAKGIVAVKTSYKNAIEALQRNVRSYSNIEIKLLPDVYPAGDEVVLVYETTGRIVPEGSIPLSVGALVLNAETVLNIHKCLEDNMPVVEKYVTVTGAVKNPITVSVPIGTEIRELINIAGGASISDYSIICGGPMTGRIVDESTVVTKTTKAVIVLPENHPIILKRKANTAVMLKRAMSVCSQCQMCTSLCPRGLLGHSIQPHKVMRSLATGVMYNPEDYTRTLLCCECGLCEMYSCHQGLSPRTLIREVKNKLRAHGVKNPHNMKPEKTHLLREDRCVPMERLISRLGLNSYINEALIDEVAITRDNSADSRVSILLNQHIGAPSEPVVKKGDKVAKGQVIGRIQEGKLGANIHASIDGIVEDIYDNTIVIKRSNK
jgi:Na+-translocating ferredoxin:NAD+ oxidoreductase RnfC subunit